MRYACHEDNYSTGSSYPRTRGNGSNRHALYTVRPTRGSNLLPIVGYSLPKRIAVFEQWLQHVLQKLYGTGSATNPMLPASPWHVDTSFRNKSTVGVYISSCTPAYIILPSWQALRPSYLKNSQDNTRQDRTCPHPRVAFPDAVDVWTPQHELDDLRPRFLGAMQHPAERSLFTGTARIGRLVGRLHSGKRFDTPYFLTCSSGTSDGSLLEEKNLLCYGYC